MNLKHIEQLEALVRAGALLWAHGMAVPVGAVFVREHAIVWAKQAARDQHEVHRVDRITLEPLSPDVINWRLPDGTLYGTLERMDAEEARQFHLEEWHRVLANPDFGPAWRASIAEEAADLLGEQ